MSLAEGTRLGPYEIADQLGAGGMGEVYRATDTRLDRTVAIKVLPEHLANDPQRRERFEREAKAVSSLNHPHICTLHDVGEQDGVHYLVMELVEGDTLQQRLEKGRLPLDQALEYAIQIADALDKAHRQGVVHRDLKPANIMIMKSAGVKLLDFGLAKLKGDAAQVSPLSQMPTQDPSAPLTAEGTIIGTLQYMAPEQLEGKDADARTDIFAFGAIAHEMVTGKKAFEGASQASLIAAILERDPQSMSESQSMTPRLLDRTIQRCLAKDADDRWQTASDLMRELKWVADEGTDFSAPSRVGNEANKTRSALALATVLLILTAASTALYFGFRADGREVLRFSLLLPERTRPTLLAHPAVSPDGRRVAYVLASAGGGQAIWIRDLNSLDALQLSGTEGAELPFWSPGGESIGFFADDRIKRVDLAGSVAQTVCTVTPDHTASGASWNRNGEILFADDGPLYLVPDTGGEPQPVTRVDASAGEALHWRPHFLPDGRHFIYHIQGSNPEDDGIHIGSLDSDETSLLMRPTPMPSTPRATCCS